MDTLKIKAADGVDLGGYEWPQKSPKAVVVIVHGMAEHAARYDRFAGELNKNGYAAIAVDLRGHGLSIQDGIKGYFASKDGWRVVQRDIAALVNEAKKRYPNVPVVLFGHSMGSIFARIFMMDAGNQIDACILSGVTINKKGLRDVAPYVAALFSLSGAKKPSKALDAMSFGAFNKPFEPAKTPFDWLSRDEDEVHKYVDDELCGFVCTPSLFGDVSKAILYTLKEENVAKIPKDLKVYIMSGAKDPVGSEGYDAHYLQDSYEKAGIAVECKVYEDARHELLNEINRDDVTCDIINFLEKAVG